MKPVRLNVLVSPEALEKADQLATLMNLSRAKAITELLEWLDPQKEAHEYHRYRAEECLNGNRK